MRFWSVALFLLVGLAGSLLGYVVGRDQGRYEGMTWAYQTCEVRVNGAVTVHE